MSVPINTYYRREVILLKKNKVLTIILFALLLLSICQTDDAQNLGTSVSLFLFKADIPLISDSAEESCTSNEILSEYSPPQMIGVTKTEVDVLSLEHWALLEKGAEYIQPFEVSSGYFCDDDFQEEANPPQKEINGLTYHKYTGKRYKGWDDFYNDMLTVFTEEYFKQLNSIDYGQLGKADTYISFNGDLYYRDGDRGADPTYQTNLDRYELIQANDQKIEFNLVAYYLSFDDVGTDGAEPESMKRCPVVLENTPSGWRIAKMTLPY